MSDAASLTFFSKQKIRCPICDTPFAREELRTGRGRLIAGKLTDELRRTYEPSKKYGEVSPLVYPVTVCPSCYFAAMNADFLVIPEERKGDADRKTAERVASVRKIIPNPEFAEPRGLTEGLASQYLALACYDFYPREFAPTIKQGLASIRAAWIANDLQRKYPSENWSYVARLFYRKARFFYTEAVEREQNGKENLPNTLHLGPDMDKNYGYDGVLYIAGLLEFRYGPREDETKRRQALERAKRSVSRLFGMGRASKSKPSIILDMARDLYARINEALGDAGSTGGEVGA